MYVFTLLSKNLDFFPINTSLFTVIRSTDDCFEDLNGPITYRNRKPVVFELPI